jgi:hypothetical protein
VALDNVLLSTDPTTIRQTPLSSRNPLKKRLFIGMATGTAATIYTAPVAPTIANAVGINPITEVTDLWFSNTDSSARTVTLYVVESGGSAADNRAVMKAVSIAANTVYLVQCAIILEAGDFLQVLADTTLKVTVLVSGIEYT